MQIVIKKCRNCGITHSWDFEGPTLKELRTIKKLTGFSGEAYSTASQEADPDALAALIYILHLRDNIKLPFEEVDLDFNDFDMIETEEEKKERLVLEKTAELQEQADGPKEDDLKNGPTQKAASRRK